MAKTLSIDFRRQCDGDLETLATWFRRGGSLDKNQREKLEAVKKQFKALAKNNAEYAFHSAYVNMMAMHLKGEEPSSTSMQKILTTLIQNLDLLCQEDTPLHLFWELLLKGEYVSYLVKVPTGKDCLYPTFLTKCFDLMRDEALQPQVTCLVVESCIPCFVKHTPEPSVMPDILDILLMELIEPKCNKSKEAVKMLLDKCAWQLADSILWMLVPTLSDENNDSTFQSSQYVYKIIFELVHINKNIVTGLINNTELCLQPYRDDRLEGLEFFCRLFSDKTIPGIENPHLFFTNLWKLFYAHCWRISWHEPEELMILAKHTASFLAHAGVQEEWCNLLCHFMQLKLEPDQQIDLITAMTTALRKDLLMSNNESVFELLKKLMTPYSPLERDGRVLETLFDQLSALYFHVAEMGINNWSLQIHDIATKLLTCMLGTCRYLSPTPESWRNLRTLFVDKFTGYPENDEKRMKMLLFLFLHSQDEWDVLHELFSLTYGVRCRLRFLFWIFWSRSTYARLSPFRNEEMLRLALLLNRTKTFSLLLKFIKPLAQSQKFKSLLFDTLKTFKSCFENRQMNQEICDIVAPEGSPYRGEVQDLMLYATEFVFDKSSMQHLLKLVKSCLKPNNEISLDMGVKRHNVARVSLHLLNEVFLMVPDLGCQTDVLNQVLAWAKLSNASHSMLALRCLTTLGLERKLDTTNNKFVIHEVIPLCKSLIEQGSRGQVKTAIQCLAQNLSTPIELSNYLRDLAIQLKTTVEALGDRADLSSVREQVLEQLLNRIELNLRSNQESELFERAVSAMGYFSSIALLPDPLKRRVEMLCVLVLRNVLGNSDQQSNSVPSYTPSDDSWVDWQELPPCVSVKIQAVRTIGRCMRFCGTHSSVEEAVSGLQSVLSPREGAFPRFFRKVDEDHLRCEAACAILYIFESEKHQSMISKQLLEAMIHIITDPRLEVRNRFAEKLCQGLCPHKRLSYNAGRSRGNLPPCFLGLLAFLGSDTWKSNQREEAKAKTLVKEVFISRQISACDQGFIARENLESFYTKNPLLVLENTMAIAVPMIAHKFQLKDSPKDSIAHEPLVPIGQCLTFLCHMLCHEDTYGGRVTKEYVNNMVVSAKQNICSNVSSSLVKIYALVFEVLEKVVKHYSPAKDCKPISPPLKLPPPFLHLEPVTPMDIPTYLPSFYERKISKYPSDKELLQSHQAQREIQSHRRVSSESGTSSLNSEQILTSGLSSPSQSHDMGNSIDDLNNMGPSTDSFTQLESPELMTPPAHSTPLSSQVRPSRPLHSSSLTKRPRRI